MLNNKVAAAVEREIYHLRLRVIFSNMMNYIWLSVVIVLF